MRRGYILLSACAALVATFLLGSHLVHLSNPKTFKQDKVLPAPSDRARTALTAKQRGEAAAAGGFERLPLSLLRIERPMRYGDWKWNDEGVPAGSVFIRVDLTTQILSVFRGGHEIGTSIILYGADQKETPLGRFPILWKGKDHRSRLYDAPMPFTLRLTGDGVAIHGSNVRWGAATHGCIGVPTDFARHLYAATSVGDPALVVQSGSAGFPSVIAR